MEDERTIPLSDYKEHLASLSYHPKTVKHYLKHAKEFLEKQPTAMSMTPQEARSLIAEYICF